MKGAVEETGGIVLLRAAIPGRASPTDRGKGPGLPTLRHSPALPRLGCAG